MWHGATPTASHAVISDVSCEDWYGVKIEPQPSEEGGIAAPAPHFPIPSEGRLATNKFPDGNFSQPAPRAAHLCFAKRAYRCGLQFPHARKAVCVLSGIPRKLPNSSFLGMPSEGIEPPSLHFLRRRIRLRRKEGLRRLSRTYLMPPPGIEPGSSR